jgi:2-keto-4-pentenoate hydratase/2-oxohepta-3-ene-1,7-dioic acid hydratase in catechol pathway
MDTRMNPPIPCPVTRAPGCAFTSAAGPRLVVAALLLAASFAVAGPAGPAAGHEARIVKWARFQAGGKPVYGLVEGERIRQVAGNPFTGWKPTRKAFRLSEVKLLVPTRPGTVLAAALNYKSHLGDTPSRPLPEVPQFFLKPTSCLIASGENIVLPPDGGPVHFEGELVVVIGKRAREVPKEKALDYVLGVTCGNDVSARDWQQNDIQWWRAKGTDTFGPCGPFIVSGLNYDDRQLETRVNGKVVQRERTSRMAQNVAALVSHASRYVTLEPGDLIYTGTPGQTSALQPGDVVEVEIEGVGVLRNEVVTGR